MGISYSAAKTMKPEVWDIGKDYYGLTDVFPPCAAKEGKDFLGISIPMLPIEQLPNIMGSRTYVDNTVFRVSDYYKSGEDIIQRIEELKHKTLHESDRENLLGFFRWAGSDEVQFISEIQDLEDREAEGEYQLCDKPSNYVFMNSWNTTAGTKVSEYYG